MPEVTNLKTVSIDEIQKPNWDSIIYKIDIHPETSHPQALTSITPLTEKEPDKPTI